MLKEAVEAALAADKRLDAAAIEITVAAGIVELSGTVGSADEVRRALQRAGRVDGVQGIVNRLRVIGRQTGLATDRTVEPSETLQVLNDQ